MFGEEMVETALLSIPQKDDRAISFGKIALLLVVMCVVSIAMSLC